MQTTTIENGCYAIEVSTGDDGLSTVASICRGKGMPIGHYVRLTPEQAATIVRHLFDHVPGLAESFGLSIDD